MTKFLGCVFGYIFLSSAIFGTLIKRGAPNWLIMVAFACFLVGWVFVIGFATDESGSIRKSMAAAKSFVMEWAASLMWLTLGAIALGILSIIFGSFHNY
ncbi:MAG: hypothetical protein AB7E55_03175 [Pigmentiphaga sp.]